MSKATEAVWSSVLNILNSPHHQLIGDLNGEKISPVKFSEFANSSKNVLSFNICTNVAKV